MWVADAESWQGIRIRSTAYGIPIQRILQNIDTEYGRQTDTEYGLRNDIRITDAEYYYGVMIQHTDACKEYGMRNTGREY